MISCEEQRGLTPEVASVQSCGCLHRQFIRTVCSGHKPRAHTSPTCINTPPLWIKGLWGRGKHTHLKGQSQLRPDSQGFCSSNLGSDPTHYRAVMDTEQSCLTPSISPSPSICSPTLCQGESCQHTLRKEVTCIHNKSSFPSKGIRNMKSVLGCAHIRSPLQDHKIKCFT